MFEGIKKVDWLDAIGFVGIVVASMYLYLIIVAVFTDIPLQ